MRTLYLLSPRFPIHCGDYRIAGLTVSDIFGMMFVEKKKREDQALIEVVNDTFYTLARRETINQSASEIAIPTETSGVGATLRLKMNWDLCMKKERASTRITWKP